jgi:hypothetical protein
MILMNKIQAMKSDEKKPFFRNVPSSIIQTYLFFLWLVRSKRITFKQSKTTVGDKRLKSLDDLTQVCSVLLCKKFWGSLLTRKNQIPKLVRIDPAPQSIHECYVPLQTKPGTSLEPRVRFPAEEVLSSVV